MVEFPYAVFTAFGLGLLCTVHPCPLTLNIAAISYICGRSNGVIRSLLMGAAFIAGYVFSLTLLTVVVMFGIFSVPGIANRLQEIMGYFIGPLLVLAGMILCKLLPWSFSPTGAGGLGKIKKRNHWSYNGTFFMGAILAVTFCPASAAVFFGVFIPLTIKFESTLLLPLFFGLGSGLPLIVSTAAIAKGISVASRIRNKENLYRRISIFAGAVLIIIGISIILNRVFGYSL